MVASFIASASMVQDVKNALVVPAVYCHGAIAAQAENSRQHIEALGLAEYMATHTDTDPVEHFRHESHWQRVYDSVTPRPPPLGVVGVVWPRGVQAVRFRDLAGTYSGSIPTTARLGQLAIPPSVDKWRALWAAPVGVRGAAPANVRYQKDLHACDPPLLHYIAAQAAAGVRESVHGGM